VRQIGANFTANGDVGARLGLFAIAQDCALDELHDVERLVIDLNVGAQPEWFGDRDALGVKGRNDRVLAHHVVAVGST